MKQIRMAVYGAGGLGKEIRGMLSQIAAIEFAGYKDDFASVAESATDFEDLVIAIADSAVRQKIAKQWESKVAFRPVISEDVKVYSSVSVGMGSILCSGVKLTVDIKIGRFVILNLNTTIGHDADIGDYCSIMPGVNISGNVKLGPRVFVGSGAVILQGITVGADAVIGAGAVVTHDVPAGTVAIGVPAKFRLS